MAASHYTEVTQVFLQRLERETEKYDCKLSAIARKRRLDLMQQGRNNIYEPVPCCKACGSKVYTIKTVKTVSGQRRDAQLKSRRETINLLKCGVCQRVTKYIVGSTESAQTQVETESLESEFGRQPSITTSTPSHQDSNSHQPKVSSKQRAKMRKDRLDLRKLLDKKGSVDNKKAASRLTLEDFLNL